MMVIRIVKVPSDDGIGILPEGIPPEVKLELTVRFRNGVLQLWVANPNPKKVEVNNSIELYQYSSRTWQKIDIGLIFMERKTVLIPGETIEQRIPIELSPGKYKVVKFAYVNGAKVRVEKEFTV